MLRQGSKYSSSPMLLEAATFLTSQKLVTILAVFYGLEEKQRWGLSCPAKLLAAKEVNCLRLQDTWPCPRWMAGWEMFIGVDRAWHWSWSTWAVGVVMAMCLCPTPSPAPATASPLFCLWFYLFTSFI